MIWCVEDDASARDITLYALRSTGFEAEGFADGLSAWHALQAQQPELMILDVMLPELDGIELLRRMKQSPQLCRVPVIMATAKGTEYDKVQSLDLGADDHIVKPFGMMELISRVRAVLRRCQGTQFSQKLCIQGLVVHLDERTVTVDGERVMLTFKEFELLRLFLTNPGKALTRDRLFYEVWGEDYCGDTRTLDMHIRTLRQKLGPYGHRIETVRNVGYRMEVHE